VFDAPLDAAQIRRYLTELAETLHDDQQRTVIIVGGALLAWHGLRESTHDVDSIKRLDTVLKNAVMRVAQRYDLAPKWLNDSAAAFIPATFKPDECEILLEHPRLLVLGIPWNQLFLMKLFASRATDTEDIEAIWPRCSFGTVDEAVLAFYEAYPHSPHDAYLADHITRII